LQYLKDNSEGAFCEEITRADPGLRRTTVYEMLSKMKDLRLVSYTLKTAAARDGSANLYTLTPEGDKALGLINMIQGCQAELEKILQGE
jgi:hypothetical protein